MLIYGRPGVGKSIFACSGQQFKTFVFDSDDGTLSLSRFQGSATTPPINPDLVTVWPNIRSYDDFNKAFTHMSKNISQYGCIVIDTATELQKFLIKKAGGENNFGTKKIQDWGRIKEQMEFLAQLTRSLPVHTIWLCHEVSRFDETMGLNVYKPSFQGAFGHDYALHFDIIGRAFMHDSMVVGQDGRPQRVSQRLIQFKTDSVTDAKDRSDRLSIYEFPNLDNVLNKALS